MTIFIEDISIDSFTPDPISPVAGDLLDGTLNNAGAGSDSTDGINLQLIAGYTYTFTLLAPSDTTLSYVPGPDAAAIFATPVIDGPGQQLTFTASASGVNTLFVGSETYADYTIDIAAVTPPIDPNAPTEGNDTVVGTSGHDAVMLLGGDDRFTGSSGNDTADGGDGRDLLFGESGNDSLTGGAGDDKMFGGNNNDTLSGGSGRDKLYGDNGSDSIDGGDGNDILIGGAGNDTLNGGNNNDRITGGGGNDVITGGQGNDKIEGGGSNDYISGGTGKDNIKGGNGDDTIIGGAGDDQMRGGNGADVFVFENGMNRDLITDFQDGVDLLDYSAMGLVDVSQLTFTQIGNHVRITSNPSDYVTIRNTDVADFTNDDFVFSALSDFDLT